MLYQIHETGLAPLQKYTGHGSGYGYLAIDTKHNQLTIHYGQTGRSTDSRKGAGIITDLQNLKHQHYTPMAHKEDLKDSGAVDLQFNLSPGKLPGLQ